jgi:hypothetical protein
MASSVINVVLQPTTASVSGVGASGEALSTRQTVTQANSFTPGQAVYRKSDGTYDLAQANGLSSANAVGIVESSNGSSFVLVTSGLLTVTSAYATFSSGSIYYLSSSAGGSLTATPPTGANNYINPIVVGVTSDTLLVMPSLVHEKIGTSLFSPVGTIIPYGSPNAPEGWRICNGDALERNQDTTSSWGQLESILDDKYYIAVSVTGQGSTGYITFLGDGDASTKNHRFANGDTFLLRWPLRDDPTDSYTDEVVVTVTGANSSLNTCQFNIIHTVTASAGLSNTAAYVEVHSFQNIGSTSSNKFFVPDLRGRTVIGGGQTA